jgi:hypothetical protein
MNRSIGAPAAAIHPARKADMTDQFGYALCVALPLPV